MQQGTIATNIASLEVWSWAISVDFKSFFCSSLTVANGLDYSGHSSFNSCLSWYMHNVVWNPQNTVQKLVLPIFYVHMYMHINFVHAQKITQCLHVKSQSVCSQWDLFARTCCMHDHQISLFLWLRGVAYKISLSGRCMSRYPPTYIRSYKAMYMKHNNVPPIEQSALSMHAIVHWQS